MGFSSIASRRRRAQRSSAYQEELARLQPFEDIARAINLLRMGAVAVVGVPAVSKGTTTSAIMASSLGIIHSR
jgi:hypothetical protein